MGEVKKVKKQLLNILYVIMDSMPVSYRKFYRQNMSLIEILQSHKEFQMMNRKDIMSLASLASNKNKLAEPKQKKPKDNTIMYG